LAGEGVWALVIAGWKSSATRRVVSFSMRMWLITWVWPRLHPDHH
jgi:hypothetical protein